MQTRHQISSDLKRYTCQCAFGLSGFCTARFMFLSSVLVSSFNSSNRDRRSFCLLDTQVRNPRKGTFWVLLRQMYICRLKKKSRQKNIKYWGLGLKAWPLLPSRSENRCVGWEVRCMEFKTWRVSDLNKSCLSLPQFIYCEKETVGASTSLHSHDGYLSYYVGFGIRVPSNC